MKTTISTSSTRFLGIFLLPFLALNSAWAGPKFNVLHNFTGGTADGAAPETRMLLDQFGDLYGVTAAGGNDITDCSTSGCGTAFQLSRRSGYWKERVLFNFSSNQNSYYSLLALDALGNIYGTSYNGGNFGQGIVYQLTQSGGAWTENVLHDFSGGTSDGDFPTSGLVQGAAGNFYGATGGGGGQYYYGTIFELTPNSDGTWVYGVIYEFGSTNVLDGSGPSGPLTIDGSGNIYGTTGSGGLYGYGTAFKLSSVAGTWTETILYNFTADYGFYPNPFGVILDHAGNLYGATTNGGAYDVGTIYKLTPATGYWHRTVLYTFTGNDDGGNPLGGLAIDSTGALYGTNTEGGSYGDGNVYKLQATKGRWQETSLHAFQGTDGRAPSTGVIRDQQGNLYGVVGSGGAYDNGVAFEITP